MVSGFGRPRLADILPGLWVGYRLCLTLGFAGLLAGKSSSTAHIMVPNLDPQIVGFLDNKEPKKVPLHP